MVMKRTDRFPDGEDVITTTLRKLRLKVDPCLQATHQITLHCDHVMYIFRVEKLKNAATFAGVSFKSRIGKMQVKLNST